MERWASKKILIVGKTIQKRLFKDSTKNQSSDMKGTPFARFMEDGKVTKALKVLENANKGEYCPWQTKYLRCFSEKVLKHLKHPMTESSKVFIVIELKVQNLHSVTLDSID